MHLLIIHHEAEYFAGAEKVLGYFLEGIKSTAHRVTIAAVRESRMAEIIPAGIQTCWLPSNARFSPGGFLKQIGTVRQLFREEPFDLVHGWAARDWELTAATARLCRRPAVGTLHDHPHAPFISKSRQRLMAGCAKVGLDKVACVSEAVRQACREAGYPPAKLEVTRNGLPPVPDSTRPSSSGPAMARLGYLGQFSERKGLRGLFEILDALARQTESPWELALAGDAQGAEGKKLVEQIRHDFTSKPWWPRVQWCGWIKRPADFLAGLDVLIVPSTEFDPFPTVLLEAGQAGIPVLASRVGGVPEIIVDGQTGWLFEARAWDAAARRLQAVLEQPDQARLAGVAAKKRVEQEFAIGRMVADYLTVYSGLAHL